MTANNSSNKIDKAAQIRQGLTQFVGALVDNLEGNKEAVAQLTAAALTEEALKLCQKEDGSTDFYVSKPILRAAHIIISSRVHELSNSIKAQEDEAVIKAISQQAFKYMTCAETIKSWLDFMDKKDGVAKKQNGEDKNGNSGTV